MKILILGAGAVGLFYGAILRKKGFLVTFFSRKAPKKPQEKLLRVKSILGDFSIKAVFTSQMVEISSFTHIFITTKAFPDIPYEKYLDGISSSSILILLQNGIGVEEKLHKLFPQNPIVGALAFICSKRKSLYEVIHEDYGFLKVAPLKKEDLPYAKEVAQLFQKTPIEVQVVEDLLYARWEKLLWNIPFNGLCTLLRANTKELIKNPSSLFLVQKLMEEVCQIASSEGASLGEKEIHSMLEKTSRMTPYKPSMLIDWEKGRRLEIEAIYEEPLRRAKKASLSTPFLEFLYKSLCFINPSTHE